MEWVPGPKKTGKRGSNRKEVRRFSFEPGYLEDQYASHFYPLKGGPMYEKFGAVLCLMEQLHEALHLFVKSSVLIT